MRIDVLFEDEDRLVVDKPAGALTVPSRMGRDDPRPCVLYQLSAERGQKLFPVHRLDEEVSGVLLFAKTAPAQREWSAWFESRRAEKEYEAWTAAGGGAPPGEQRFEDRLHRGKKRAFRAAHGKDALTIARVTGEVEWRGARRLRWQLLPKTGRAHQLRVQLALRGFPITGDRLYGSTDDFLPEAIALRAVRLTLDRDFVAADLAAFCRQF